MTDCNSCGKRPPYCRCRAAKPEKPKPVIKPKAAPKPVPVPKSKPAVPAKPAPAKPAPLPKPATVRLPTPDQRCIPDGRSYTEQLPMLKKPVTLPKLEFVPGDVVVLCAGEDYVVTTVDYAEIINGEDVRYHVTGFTGMYEPSRLKRFKQGMRAFGSS